VRMSIDCTVSCSGCGLHAGRSLRQLHTRANCPLGPGIYVHPVRAGSHRPAISQVSPSAGAELLGVEAARVGALREGRILSPRS
jgi:hypothetical protein